MTLRLRKEILTELHADELRALAAGALASVGTCPIDECIERLISAAIYPCITSRCLSGEPSCPC